MKITYLGLAQIMSPLSRKDSLVLLVKRRRSPPIQCPRSWTDRWFPLSRHGCAHPLRGLSIPAAFAPPRISPPVCHLRKVICALFRRRLCFPAHFVGFWIFVYFIDFRSELSLPFAERKAKYHEHLRAAVDVVDRACRLCVDVRFPFLVPKFVDVS